MLNRIKSMVYIPKLPIFTDEVKQSTECKLAKPEVKEEFREWFIVKPNIPHDTTAQYQQNGSKQPRKA